MNHLAICRRVVPCFASAEYEGPSTRAGRFIYGGSLLDNVQKPSAEDLARAGYEPVAATGERESASDLTVLHNDNPQTGDRQTHSTGDEFFETSDPAPTSIDRSFISPQPTRFHCRPILERTPPYSRMVGHAQVQSMAGQPLSQRFRPESYDRTIRHRSWTPDHTMQSEHAVAETWHDVGRSRRSLGVDLTLPEIRRLPTLRMPDGICCEEEQVKER